MKNVLTLWLAVGLLLAACGRATPTAELPPPPPAATLTRVPTVTIPAPTATSANAPTPTLPFFLTPEGEVTPTPSSLFPAVTADDWRDGPNDAAVTLLAYTDFQCGLCAQVALAMRDLRREHPNDVRLVLRHFPLSQHDKARLAAIGAEAAGVQGEFWGMHDLLFKKQAEWVSLTPDAFRDKLVAYATELGLAPQKFAGDLDDPELAERVEAAYQAAADIPLPGTPFLLFNGAPIHDETMLNHWALSTLVRLELLKAIQFSEPPPDIINPFKAYTATLHTERGDVVIELFTETAPVTVNNFVFLAREGWYDGVTFHRVIPGFAVQTGDPSGTGYGGPGYYIGDEINPAASYDAPGWVGMANAGPNTNGSQFFITLAARPELDGQYTQFGRVVSGMEVLNALTPRDPNVDPEAPPGDVLNTVTIEEEP